MSFRPNMVTWQKPTGATAASTSYITERAAGAPMEMPRSVQGRVDGIAVLVGRDRKVVQTIPQSVAITNKDAIIWTGLLGHHAAIGETKRMHDSA